MSNFTYVALKNFEKVSGTISAETKEEAILMLENANYNIIKIKRQIFTLKSRSTKLTQQDLIAFFSSMSSMDRVNIDVLQSLEMMKNDIATTPNLTYVCEKLYFAVLNGSTLSEACASASKSFSDDFVGLIKIAEETGNFSNIFDQIVDYIKWSYEMNKRSRSAMLGPIVTLIMTFVIIVVMSILVLPKITTFLDEMGGKTPWYTTSLIVFAGFIQKKWYIVTGIIGGSYLIIKLLSLANENIRIKIDFLKIKIPGIGDLLLKMDVSRFISFFSLMYNSGADILTIISSVSNTVKNKYIGHRIKNMKYNILNGDTIFQAIDKEQVFPKMFRKLVSICDATGEVGNVLINVKFFYDQETKDVTDKMVALIKPVLTIILGGIVLWMALAMMMPIYSNMGSIGQTQIE